MGENHAIEKVVLSTLNSNWLLSLIILNRLSEAGDDSRSWNFPELPPDVIHAPEADKTMSQTNRTI